MIWLPCSFNFLGKNSCFFNTPIASHVKLAIGNFILDLSSLTKSSINNDSNTSSDIMASKLCKLFARRVCQLDVHANESISFPK